MTGRRVISGLLLAAAFAASAAAAAPPRINHLTNEPRLSDRDRAAIREYAEYWCDQLMSDDPEKVDEARVRLIEPLRAVQITEVFRFEYSDDALDRLQKVVAGGNPQSAVGAVQVMALLGTPRALEALVELADITKEKRFGVRLWAAKAFPLAVQQGTVPENDVNRALRQLGQAASREEDWLILRRQFEAIVSVEGRTSRDVQINVLEATTKRMGQGPAPSDLMQAIYPSLKLLRDEYLQMKTIDQGLFGKALAPALGEVCTVADRHWDQAQASDAARKAYGGAVLISETLLTMIHGTVGGTSVRTQLGPAWRDRDRGRFNADQNTWQAILRQPPYNGRH